MIPFFWFFILFLNLTQPTANAFDLIEDYLPSEHVTLPLDETRGVTNSSSLVMRESTVQVAARHYRQQGEYEVNKKELASLESNYSWLRGAYLSRIFGFDLSTDLGRKQDYKQKFASGTKTYSEEKTDRRIGLAWAALTELYLGLSYQETQSKIDRKSGGSNPSSAVANLDEEKSVTKLETSVMLGNFSPFYPMIKVARINVKESYVEEGSYNRYAAGLGFVEKFSSSTFRFDVVYSKNNEFIKSGKASPLYIHEETLLSMGGELKFPFIIGVVILGGSIDRGERQGFKGKGEEKKILNTSLSGGIKFNNNITISSTMEQSKFEPGPKTQTSYKRFSLGLAYSFK